MEKEDLRKELYLKAAEVGNFNSQLDDLLEWANRALNSKVIDNDILNKIRALSDSVKDLDTSLTHNSARSILTGDLQTRDIAVLPPGYIPSMSELKRYTIFYDRIALIPAVIWLFKHLIHLQQIEIDRVSRITGVKEEHYHTKTIGAPIVYWGATYSKAITNKYIETISGGESYVINLLDSPSNNLFLQRRLGDVFNEFGGKIPFDDDDAMPIYQRAVTQAMVDFGCPAVSVNPCLDWRVSGGDQPSETSVLQMAMYCVPNVPDDTPWTKIAEIRADKEAQDKYRRLRKWGADVAKGKDSLKDLAYNLPYLINEFEEHMHLHQIKTGVGAMETIFVPLADALHDIVTFKWGSAIKPLLEVKNRRIKMLEAERSAPGRELAYVSYINKNMAE